MANIDESMLTELIAINERLARLIDLTIETMTSNSSYDYQPWAMRMSAEFVCVQDANNDGEVFGHTFFIDDLDHYPPILMPVRQKIEALRKLPDQGITEFMRLKAVSPTEYVKTLSDDRDRKAVKFIFRIED